MSALNPCLQRFKVRKLTLNHRRQSFIIHLHHGACRCAAGVFGFQPKKKGSYQVEVTQEGKPIKGSPFRVEVGDGQLCQASKVKVSGASKEATANKWNDIHINLADAGTKSRTVEIMR